MLFVYLTAAGFIIFIFPLFVKIEIFYDKDIKKVFFALTLYGKIKIIGGYAQLIKEGAVFHISANKAILLPYKNLLGMRKQFSLTTDYKVYSFSAITELGSESAAALPFMTAVAENIASKLAFVCINAVKPRINLQNNVLLYEDKDVFKLNLSVIFIFNLLTITLTFGKIILGKIINGKRK